MKLVTAQVVQGRIEVPTQIADGSHVAILAPDDGDPHVLSSQEEEQLDASLAEIRTCNYIAGEDLLAELKAKSRK